MRQFTKKIWETLPQAPGLDTGKIDARHLQKATVTAQFSDPTANGTLSLLFSNDPIEWREPDDWQEVTSVAANGITVDKIKLGSDVAYRWVKVTWTSTAGAGTITANLHCFGQ